MNYRTEALEDSQDNLITSDNSAGIIEEAEVERVAVEVPSNFRMEGGVETLTPSVELGEATEVLEAEPTSMTMGNFNDPFEDVSQHAVDTLQETKDTTWMDSVKASVQLWDTYGLYKQAELESKIVEDEAGLYAPELDFDVREAISLSEIPLTLAESKWLDQKGIKSQAEFNVYMNKIESDNKLAQTAGRSPVTAFALGMVDPVYIAGGLGVGKLAQVARLGRFGTALTVGASEYGAVYAQQYHRPVEMSEMLLGAVLPSVITLGVYRRPKSKQNLDGSQVLGEEPVVGKAEIGEAQFDPTLGKAVVSKPNKTTIDYAGDIDDVNVVRNTPLTEKYSLIKPDVENYKTNEFGLPSRDVIDWNKVNERGVAVKDTAYRYAYDVIENNKVPKSIRESTLRLLLQAGEELANVKVRFNSKLKIAGKYNLKDNSIELKGGHTKPSGSTLNHEIVHALTSIRLHYGKANPKSGHGAIVGDIEQLRNYVKGRFKDSKQDYTPSQQKEIEYSLKDNDEFLSGLYEGDTAFKKLMSETPVDYLKSGDEKSLMQVLYKGFRKLLGLTTEEARALNKALKLSEDLIDTPMVKYTDLDGKVHEFRASEVTPKLIEEVASKEADNIFKQLVKALKAGWDLGWNLHKTMAKASQWFSDTVLSSPMQGEMKGNVVSSKRALSGRLGQPRTNAEQMLIKEGSARGVTLLDRMLGSKRYHDVYTEMQAEVALYVERRSQAEKLGVKLPDEDTPIARIAQEYNKMTTEAKEAGVRSGIFDEEVGKVNYYMPRKIDPTAYQGVLKKFESVFGEAEGKNRLIDYIAKTFNFIGGDAEYARHIAYIYHKRMNDAYHNVGDQFRGHMGRGVVEDVNKMLDEMNVTDVNARKQIESYITGVVDSKGEAGFQRARLDINTLQEFPLPDGSSFKFFDLMDTNVIESYARYADNVSGRVALAEHGLGTPTLREEAKKKVTGSEYLANKPGKRKRYGRLVDNIFDDILGYPVGEELHPFLVAMRAFTQSVALKFSGIWQLMEFIPTITRHSKASGVGRTFKEAFKAFTTPIGKLERTQANSLATSLVRSSMDDLKISPITSRMSDNYSLDTSTVSAKLMHLSQYTHVLNAMRFFMGKQSIMSANLIVNTLEESVKGNGKTKHLLKNFGFTDRDFKMAKAELDAHGTDFSKWSIDAKAEVYPKLVNLMDTDVLRGRLGELPAIMQFSQVGKVLGTFRNFIISAHNKLFASQLKDEGVFSVALLTAYQLPIAMLSVQVASLAKGEKLIEDPEELIRKAFTQLGGLGLIPEMVGILSGDTRSFGSPFMLGLDRVIGIGNAVGGLASNAIQGEASSEDFLKVLKAGTGAIPLVSVTLGVGAGVDAVLSTIAEQSE